MLSGAIMPDYESHNVTRVANSVFACLTGAGEDCLNLNADSIVVVMIDGLGWHLLERYRAHARTLWAMAKETAPATSTAPSTTAAAITATMTGRPPALTNMVGYSVRVQGVLTNLINFSGAQFNTREWQPCRTLPERLSDAGVPARIVLQPSYHGSGLTLAALRGGQLYSATTSAQRLAAVSRHGKQPGFTYVYWSDVDHAGHHDGVGSATWVAALEDVDAAVAQMRRGLADSTRIIIVADHGMVDSDADQRIDIATRPHLQEGVVGLAGEPRAVHVHCAPGQSEQVRSRWQECLGDRCWFPTAEEAERLIGGENPYQGDFQVYARNQTTIVDSLTQPASMITMPGVHGSLTEAEMHVPLLVV